MCPFAAKIREWLRCLKGVTGPAVAGPTRVQQQLSTRRLNSLRWLDRPEDWAMRVSSKQPNNPLGKPAGFALSSKQPNNPLGKPAGFALFNHHCPT